MKKSIKETARETILKILPLVDILFVSEESSRRMFQKECKKNIRQKEP